MDFSKKVYQTTVQKGQIAVFWLGQAGFLIKTDSGKLIAIDPYFSDCVERLIPEEGLGFKRLMPALCAADDLVFDTLIISHEHYDHFDVDAINDMMKNGRTVVYTNSVAATQMIDIGLDASRVHVLEKARPVTLEDCTLLPVDCDHGALAPEAMGVILEFPHVKLYYAGDTALTPDRLQVPLKTLPDVAILPINGAFGNLDSKAAAEYAAMLKCRFLIPCHFWTFPLHYGEPMRLIRLLPELAPECTLKMLCQGESALF
ncbi:MAG: MBL fold metallo-hydrolase [Christensenellales bacterium]|jgi:L-ascorbate 6-phosphate lactonase